MGQRYYRQDLLGLFDADDVNFPSTKLVVEGVEMRLFCPEINIVKASGYTSVVTLPVSLGIVVVQPSITKNISSVRPAKQ
jgi:hypothetical protein